jgi:intracellular sulfur oxidation DsrE/DsrF family protein
MTKKSLKAAVLALAVSAAAAPAPEFHGAEPSRERYRVIFHVDSDAPGLFKKVLNNARNVLDDPRLKGRVEVELIANSRGYRIYQTGNGFEPELKALADRGVILAQCGNTLRELKVDRAALYPFASVVPSAMGELTIRQGDGWAYVHPSI